MSGTRGMGWDGTGPGTGPAARGKREGRECRIATAECARAWVGEWGWLAGPSAATFDYGSTLWTRTGSRLMIAYMLSRSWHF